MWTKLKFGLTSFSVILLGSVTLTSGKWWQSWSGLSTSTWLSSLEAVVLALVCASS